MSGAVFCCAITIIFDLILEKTHHEKTDTIVLQKKVVVG